MTTVTQNRQAIFPDVPRESPAVDKNGDFTQYWSLGLGALFQALQVNFKNEGIVFPPLTATQMATIQSFYAAYIGQTFNSLTLALPDISGQTIYGVESYLSYQFIIAKDSAPDPVVILAKWVPFAFMLTGVGNPNGSVAGVINWQYLDTSGPTLYVCTASGSISTATWSSGLTGESGLLLTI